MEDNIFKSLSDYLLEQETRKLVGKVCKRFEISDDKEQIKRDVKEIIYEWVRDFRDSLNAGKFVLKISTENQKK